MSTCAVCKSPLGATRQGPFCSPRCRTIDLGKWLGGDYVISRPLGPDDADDEALAELMLRDADASRLS